MCWYLVIAIPTSNIISPAIATLYFPYNWVEVPLACFADLICPPCRTSSSGCSAFNDSFNHCSFKDVILAPHQVNKKLQQSFSTNVCKFLSLTNFCQHWGVRLLFFCLRNTQYPAPYSHFHGIETYLSVFFIVHIFASYSMIECKKVYTISIFLNYKMETSRITNTNRLDLKIRGVWIKISIE